MTTRRMKASLPGVMGSTVRIVTVSVPSPLSVGVHGEERGEMEAFLTFQGSLRRLVG